MYGGSIRIRNPKTLQKWFNRGWYQEQIDQGYQFAVGCGRFRQEPCTCSKCRKSKNSPLQEVINRNTTTMILSFSRDYFRAAILDGVKLHTIRTDESMRWKTGMTIHMWLGNPRNTKRNPAPYQFYETTCTGVEAVRIYPPQDGKSGRVEIAKTHEAFAFKNVPIKVLEEPNELGRFAQNDGFTSIGEFFDWFNLDKCEVEDNRGSFYEGRIIHWTLNFYNPD